MTTESIESVDHTKSFSLEIVDPVTRLLAAPVGAVPFQVDRLSNEAYHAVPAINKSRLSLFRESRRMYEAKFVHGIEPRKKREAPELSLGSLTHAAVLTPEDLPGFEVIPADVLTQNGQRRGKKWETYKADCEERGVEPVTEEIAETAKEIQQAVLSVAPFLRNQGVQREVSIFWVDDATGLPCKCRPDALYVADEAITILDLKTAADVTPRGFEKAMGSWEYWLQAVHYTEGVRALYGDNRDVYFVFIAVRSDLPYLCRMYAVDDEAWEYATKEYLHAMDELGYCHRSGDWSDADEAGVLALRPYVSAMES